MKIHIFIAHMGLGGAERVCVNLANELSDRGHEVHIVTLNLDGDINTRDLAQGIEVHTLGVSRLRYSMLPMLRYVRRYRPSFMLVFGNEMAIILGKLRKLHLTDVKLAVRVLNNVNITLAKEDGISPVVENYLRSAQKVLKDMDHIVAQCEAMGSQLIEKGLVHRDKLSVIYNPVSEALIKKTVAIRDDSSSQDDGREVVFIGRIDPQKNPWELMEIFAGVKERVAGARLRLVGDGVLRKEIEKKADELGLGDSVIFDGIRTDMEKVYANADVVVLTSDYEGMPNCLIEAIGCGVPIVSYDCPIGPAEIVIEGVNGHLIRMGDTAAATDAIVKILSMEPDRERIMATADKFRVGRIADRYTEIFRSLDSDK